MIEIKQILIPLALFIFISIVVIIGLVLLFQYLNKRLALKTALELINYKQEINSSLIESLVKDKPKQNFDLRVGILCLIVSFVFFFIGFLIGGHGYLIAKLSFLGIGLFPGLIGLTLLGFHFFNIKNK
jgi:hypothetical protein